MRLSSLLLVPFLAIACGCGGSSDQAASGDEADQTGTSWQKLLECENGSVVVDVDSGERRHVQVVVRQASSFPALDATITYSQTKNANERIYKGDSPWGVFSQDQLRHFRTYQVSRDASGRMLGLDVLRSGETLTLRALDLGKRGCQPYSRNTSPPDDAYPDSCETANYVFHGCR